MSKIDMAGLIEEENQVGTRYYVDKSGEVFAKECTKCLKVKELAKYTAAKKKLGGKESTCKECRRKYYQENKSHIQEYKLENIKESRSYQRKYRQENREKLLENEKNYRIANAEKIREYGKKYYQENKVYIIKGLKEYRQKNREKYSLYERRRKARKSALPDNLTPKQQDSISKQFGNGCSLTGHTEDIHLDHVIPISIGHGGTTFGNMIPLNGRLNESKGATHLYEWFDANHARFNLEKTRFDELIKYLSEANGMTTQEYRKYTDWCFDNPRSFSILDDK